MSRPARTLLLIVALVILGAVVFVRQRSAAPRNVPVTNALELLIQFEKQEAERYWGPELRAQKFGAAIDQLWNRLNASTNKLALLAELQPELLLPRFANAVRQDFPHGIRVISPTGGSWREVFSGAISNGWTLEQCEFRQTAFYTNQMGRGLASSYYVSGHLVNARADQRALVEGNAMIWWNERPDLPPVRTVDARQLKIRLRDGPPPFIKVFEQEIAPPEGSYFIDPIILWDLDSNGATELIFAAKNLVYRREQTNVWLPAPLLESSPGLIFTAILGDFTGNGTADFAFANFDGISICEGTEDGRFPGASQRAWTAQPRLRYGQVLTAGDVDGDGDLDLFLGQYKVPYEKGQMPFPYFDANDGHPSFLLFNDGRGYFTDATSAAGLAAKRGRRVYSASFADLDADADLDLVVISDFAGLDAYENNGSGRFTDRTKVWFPETYAFGMAHAFLDFNADRVLDLMMIGMNSPTADRLASLRLSRPYEMPDPDLRSRVTYGNRLFFGQPGAAFRQLPVNDYVARTGWSWGVAVEDFDNDGFPDLYIANGHETRQSVEEYEPEFWLHDIYIGNSRENTLAHAYFRDKYSRTRGRGHSYGGYERNRFFLNIGGTNVVEAAHLFGIAMPEDSRNVLAEDFNSDGKLDLLVTTFEAWPVARQTVRLFENRLPNTGHWVSVALKPTPALYGARAEAAPGGARVFSTGDSYRVQRPFKLHLGLGARTNAPVITIRPIRQPAHSFRPAQIDRLHLTDPVTRQ